MAKHIAIQCGREIADIIISALNWFVEQHYPSGADECSIAARDALFALAHRFEAELLAEGRSSYSIRMRAFLSEAVRSYLEQRGQQSGTSYANRSRVVIDVCRGNSDGEEFVRATSLDEAQAGPEC